MIWATVSSWSFFAAYIELFHLWLQRISDFDIDHLVMSMCRVFCCVVGRGCLLWPVQNSVSHCPASFCTPRSNLPFTPGISWLPTFALQSHIMKRTFKSLKKKKKANKQKNTNHIHKDSTTMTELSPKGPISQYTALGIIRFQHMNLGEDTTIPSTANFLFTKQAAIKMEKISQKLFF